MFWNTDIDFLNVPELDVLAIGAQPGDVELSSGGTLKKMSAAGYKTGVLDLTRGEMTGGGLTSERLEESKRAGECLALFWRGTLAMPDARLENSIGARMTLAGTVRRLRPRTLILPALGSRHPDSFYTAELGWESAVLSGIPAVDDYSEVHSPERVIFTCDEGLQFAVDVTEEFGAVKNALRCYVSRFGSLEFVIEKRRVALAYAGSKIGVGLAEGFASRDLFSISDIVKMDLGTLWS